MPFAALLRRSSSRAEHDDGSQPSSQDAENKTAFLKRFRRRHDQKDGETSPEVHESMSSGAPESTQAKSSRVERPAINPTSISQPSQVSDKSVVRDALGRKDMRALFYGAPHFMVEKGRHRQFYPQVIFPWNRELEIADLWDRRPLRHESFELATLHAHLPIPDEYSVLYGSSKPIRPRVCWKGPTWEVGVFEVPNMLGYEGREIGTVGFRHFMELPVSDDLRKEHGAQSHDRDLHGSSAKASHGTTRWASHRDDLVDIAQPLQRPRDQDAWTSLGIRSLTFQAIAERLEEISHLHDLVVTNRQSLSILAVTDVKTLHEQLFNHLLYLPETDLNIDGPKSLGIQIDALIKVLARPGIWLDLSLPRYRMEPGRILWATESHDQRESNDSEVEKKCLYIQILLAIELFLRLDAVMKCNIARTAGTQTKFSADDLRRFNRIRNRKTDFDLAFAARFLNYFKVNRRSDPQGQLKHDSEPNPRESCAQKSCVDHSRDLILIPRRAPMQLEGLVQFAQDIRWPTMKELDLVLSEKLREKPRADIASSHQLSYSEDGQLFEKPQSPPSHATAKLSVSTHNPSQTESNHCQKEQYDQSHRVVLQTATATNTGGWLSQSWLSGLVLPGDSITHLLMAALLENDPGLALGKLGQDANLLGGFILGDRSCWSKHSVLSRILGSVDGAAECMGWITVIAPFSDDGNFRRHGWITVNTEAAPERFDSPRLFDGPKVVQESSPLGVGHGKVQSTEFRMPKWNIYNGSDDGDITLINVHLHTSLTPQNESRSASVEFSVSRGQGDHLKPERHSVRLRYDVYFVCSQPCRLPLARRILRTTGDLQSEGLLAHPLHQSFRYRIIAVTDLLSDRQKGFEAIREAEEVLVIDARGSYHRDTLARAWCSEVGHHALVSREGKVCISCSVREAKALGIEVIIRIGACHGLEIQGPRPMRG